MTRFSRALILGVATPAVAYVMALFGSGGRRGVSEAAYYLGNALLWPAIQVSESVSLQKGLVLTFVAVFMWSGIWAFVFWVLSKVRQDRDSKPA